MRRVLLMLSFILLFSLMLMPVSEAAPMVRGVGVFFYPWYSHWYHWQGINGEFEPPKNWTSHYLPDVLPGVALPQVELYESNDERIILWQLYEMRQAHVSYAISSWWGPGKYEDHVLDELMNITESNISPHPNLKWCIIYEMEGYSDPSVSKITSDLRYILRKYANRRSYLRVNGKPVIFVYSGRNDGVNYTLRWYEANRALGRRFFVVLRVFPGYQRYANYSDSWFQYAPVMRFELQGEYSGFVSPGFWKIWNRDWPIELPRDPMDFRKALTKLINSPVGIKTVQTWNEWHEGTQVEPGQVVTNIRGTYYPLWSYGEEYVRIMRSIIPPLYPYEPELHVEPDVVTGDPPFIQIIGSGFPGNSVVHLLVDGKIKIGDAKSDPNGNFAWDLKPQLFPEGFHVILARSGNVTAVASFYRPREKVVNTTIYKTTTESTTQTMVVERWGGVKTCIIAFAVITLILSVLILKRGRG